MDGPYSVPEDLLDPQLRRLYAYWAAKRGGRAMPGRPDIDPLELHFILGNLILIDVLRAPLRFRFRLYGTALAHRAGYELTGRMLDELPATEFRAFVEESFTKVVETGTPRWALRERVMDSKQYRYETLLLPLSRDGELVDMLLIGMRYID